MNRFLLVISSFASYTKMHRVPVLNSLLRTIFSPTVFRYILLILIVLSGYALFAQTDNAYRKVVTERSAKIVTTLEITDSNKYNKVVNQLADQYVALNTIHEEAKTAITAIKSQSLGKEEAELAIKKEEDKKMSRLLQLHATFIAHLKTGLTDEQVEKVKDGMTYRVFPLTFAAYQDMLPRLTAEQKNQIYTWLKEARELAMDAESSDKKHAVFGKYKGKINNYLSAAGYDMKKEGEEWQKRIKEREKKEPGSR
jgi:hypothetical protein